MTVESQQVIIAGYGGIGKALAKQLIDQGHHVTILTRQGTRVNDQAKTIEIDITNPASISQLVDLARKIQPHTVINTIGILHQNNHLPEKNIMQVTDDWLLESMRINLLPTLHLAKAITQQAKPQTPIKFMSLSARVGSITDNKLGGWYSYRTSKAALNMLVKTIALEWKRSLPTAAIYAYHPGTVDTPLSKPFQQRVPADQLFTTKQAAEHLLSVLNKLTTDDSGHLFDWRGNKVEF